MAPSGTCQTLGMPLSQRQKWEVVECCTAAPTVTTQPPLAPWQSRAPLGGLFGIQVRIWVLMPLTSPAWTFLYLSLCFSYRSFVLSRSIWREGESNLVFHMAQRKIYFRINICMYTGCELFTKQAAYNGFQFLLTATCIDCDSPWNEWHPHCQSGVRQNSPSLYPQNSIMSDHMVVSA